MRGSNNPHRRRTGTGHVGDPWIDQFQAGQNSTPQDNIMAHTLWASRGSELLDRIGHAIISVHSAGGPFAWLVANERPNLVKAIVNGEGAGAPFTPEGLGPDRRPTRFRSARLRPQATPDCHGESAGRVRNRTVSARSRAGSQAEKSTGYPHCLPDRRVFRPHAKPARGGVAQTGGLERRRFPIEGPRHTRQPLHDAREQPPPGLRPHPWLGRRECEGVS